MMSNKNKSQEENKAGIQTKSGSHRQPDILSSFV